MTAALGLFLLGCAPDSGSGLLEYEVPPRNVLMISVDTLRADHVSRYREDRLTPFLDGILEEGVALDDHRSCSSWTYPSVSCALTGRSLVDMGFIPLRDTETSLPKLPREVDTLASLLQAEGFQTGLVSGNALLGSFTLLDRGYERALAMPLAEGEEIRETGLQMLDSMGSEQPWFLHLHFMDPHMPYSPPERYLEAVHSLYPVPFDLSIHAGYQQAMQRWDELSAQTQDLIQTHARLRYEAEMRHLDDVLQGLWRELEDRGALEDTLVVIWSDHGEQFWDHGDVAHGNANYAEENRALAAFWSRDLEALAWEEPTHHQDLAPSVLDALQLSLPRTMDGAPAGTGEGIRFAHTLSLAPSRSTQAADQDGFRLHYRWDGSLELYDLSRDPEELSDIYHEQHPALETLWPLLRPQVERAWEVIGGERPPGI